MRSIQIIKSEHNPTSAIISIRLPGMKLANVIVINIPNVVDPLLENAILELN
jgi:hypothetical protein